MRKILTILLILTLLTGLLGCDYFESFPWASFFPSLASPAPTPNNSPAFPPATTSPSPTFSTETSESCPGGHQLVYHAGKANCLTDGGDPYYPCANCTEYSTFAPKAAIGHHTLVCSEEVCPYDGHRALHVCQECGFGMVAADSNRYYVSRLTVSQYEAYRIIYDGIMNFEAEITLDVGVITRDEWSNVLLWALAYDSPELMQLGSNWGSTTIETLNGTFVTKIRPSYIMTVSEYYAALDLVADTFTGWQSQLVGSTEYEMELFVHDYITGTTTYSADATNASNAYGVLNDRQARCEGYSKTMTWAMWSMGIPCTSIIGTAGGVPHSFNAVALDGTFSFVDITWDLGQSFPHHDYFNVDEQTILLTHQIDEDFIAMGYPECTTLANNYAVKNGLYFDADNEHLLAQKLVEELNKAYADNDYVIELRFSSPQRAEALKSTVIDVYNSWSIGKFALCTLSMGNTTQIMLKLD